MAQALSATLGGTLLRYTTTIGIFAFSLGMGALAYGRLQSRFRTLRTFAALQIVMAVTGAIGPYFILASDPLSHSGPTWFWNIVSYLPVFFTGFISGFELPLLMDHAPCEKTAMRTLGADYCGMFLGSVLFPLTLLPLFGVYGTAFVAAFINFGTLLLIPLLLRQRNRQQQSKIVVESANAVVVLGDISRVTVMVLIAATAFCSMCYEFLIAKLLAEFGNDDVLSQSWTIGTFLLGMGIGAWWCVRIPRLKPLRLLLKIEIALTVVGALSAVVIYGGATYFELYWLDRATRLFNSNQAILWIGIFQPFALLVGILSGFELPLLMKSRPFASAANSGIPLALSYFGGLLASFIVPLFLLPSLGSLSSVVIVAMVNLLCCLALVRPAGLSWMDRRLVWLVPASTAVCVAAFFGPKFQQAYLKTHYVEIRLFEFSLRAIDGFLNYISILGRVERIETPYQSIDIVDESVTRAAPGFGQDFSLYLNKQPQFSRSTLKSYHEAFAHGAIHLSGSVPKSVLILGGGDGLLAGELLRHSQVEKITLVELDAAMIRLSSEDARITGLNRGALTDQRVDVKIDDGFRYIRTTMEKFDAVYIDFPYPVNYDLLKLFSVEFYQSVRNRLLDGGFAVMDAPIWKMLDAVVVIHPQPHEVMLSTLAAAGFETRFPYGPTDPFVFVEVKARTVQFDHSRLPAWISNRGYVNMNDIDHVVGNGATSPDYVNSVFRPRRFR